MQIKTREDTTTSLLKWKIKKKKKKENKQLNPKAQKPWQSPVRTQSSQDTHHWWESNTVQPLWKTVWQFVTEMDHILHNPAISHLAITQEKWKQMFREKPVLSKF